MIRIYSNQVKYFILEKNTLEMKTLSCLTSKFWGIEIDHRPSEVNSGQKYFCCLKVHIIITQFLNHAVNNLSNFYWHFLSRSVFETFDIKILYRYLSLSRTVFEIFDFKVFRVWLWPLTFRGYLRSKLFHIRKPIHDFLSNFYWHFLSISYRFRDIRLQSF